MAQRGAHHDEEALAHQMANASDFLKQGFEELGLTVSSKTNYIASSNSMGDKLSDRLTEHGLRLDMVSSTRDLGINASSGAARRTAIPAQRVAKARKRGLKAKFIHNQSGKRAARLYKGGIHPVSAYGIEALGAAPTTLRHLRAAAAKLSPYAGSGACATTAIDLGHGKSWDPAVRLRVQIIDTWIETWHQQSGRARHEVAVAWGRIARRMKACRPTTAGESLTARSLLR